MHVLVLNQAEVAALLPMRECIEAMAAALETLARGGAVLPLRPLVRLPENRGVLGMMPAYLDAPRALGVKVISVFPANHGTRFDSHQGAVLLFDTEHGQLLALMDASAITAIRTAAVSGVATRALARTDAGDLAILGAGVQAGSHLQAMMAVRQVRRVRVWSRTTDHASTFAERMSDRHRLVVEACASARDAVEGADLICTTTASPTPVLEGAWLAAGAHINVVGSSVPSAREVDTAAVVRSRLYVDRRESALAESGDILMPRGEGAIGDDHIVGELGDVLLGRAPGRGTDQDITLFKSLGLAVEDVAAAHHVYARARAEGVGTSVEFSGAIDASA